MNNRRENKTDKTKVKYIVVHQTGTKPGVVLRDLNKLPYHYVITKAGRLINLRPVKPSDGTVEVALSGGLDSYGNHMDGRTQAQKDTLFLTLSMLADTFPDAIIIGADELYVYGFPNPGFNVNIWLGNYIAAFLAA